MTPSNHRADGKNPTWQAKTYETRGAAFGKRQPFQPCASCISCISYIFVFFYRHLTSLNLTSNPPERQMDALSLIKLITPPQSAQHNTVFNCGYVRLSLGLYITLPKNRLQHTRISRLPRIFQNIYLRYCTLALGILYWDIFYVAAYAKPLIPSMSNPTIPKQTPECWRIVTPPNC